jgi:16S rRNA (adenine1518-N6/adenine1519-N6)-dimethyltransferase
VTAHRAPRAGAAGGEAGDDRSRPPRPKALRRYGQNHLVDGNILRAIVDQAAVGPDDVVLEVGAAGGLLTRPLLQRARLVHAFEIDGRWLPRLEELAAAQPGLRLHAGDALKADLGALDPAPTALVANLAYNIAIPLIMTTIVELPSVVRWAVMVQKELADRLFARPRIKAYAAVSVLTQLACRRESVRDVPPSAFRPRPRVDSSFITFVRRTAASGTDRAREAPGRAAATAQTTESERVRASATTAEPPPLAAAEPPVLSPAAYAAMDRLVRQAFGQRRKMLGTSLAGAASGGLRLTRGDVHRALERLDLPSTSRPEELTPGQWVKFAGALGWLTDEPTIWGTG